jgi:hypothetical protein
VHHQNCLIGRTFFVAETFSSQPTENRVTAELHLRRRVGTQKEDKPNECQQFGLPILVEVVAKAL